MNGIANGVGSLWGVISTLKVRWFRNLGVGVLNVIKSPWPTMCIQVVFSFNIGLAFTGFCQSIASVHAVQFMKFGVWMVRETHLWWAGHSSNSDRPSIEEARLVMKDFSSSCYVS